MGEESRGSVKAGLVLGFVVKRIETKWSKVCGSGRLAVAEARCLV